MYKQYLLCIWWIYHRNELVGTPFIILDVFFACQPQAFRGHWMGLGVQFALALPLFAASWQWPHKSNISSCGSKPWLDYCNFTQQVLPPFGYKQHVHATRTLVWTCTDQISFTPAAYKGLNWQSWPCRSWKSLNHASLSCIQSLGAQADWSR